MARPQRAMRAMIRQRTQLIQERASGGNRMPQVLEGANRKLASVATARTGGAAPARLQARVDGQTDLPVRAQLAKSAGRAGAGTVGHASSWAGRGPPARVGPRPRIRAGTHSWRGVLVPTARAARRRPGPGGVLPSAGGAVWEEQAAWRAGASDPRDYRSRTADGPRRAGTRRRSAG
jgi:hypothetical protein